MINRATVGSVFTMNDLRAVNEILEVEDIRECGQLQIILEKLGLWKSGHYKLSLQLSPKIDLERESVKKIVLLVLWEVSMVCVESDLANMARLVGVTMSNLAKEHLKVVKWVKVTLSHGMIHR